MGLDLDLNVGGMWVGSMKEQGQLGGAATSKGVGLDKSLWRLRNSAEVKPTTVESWFGKEGGNRMK